MRDYWSFARANARFLAFGVLLGVVSSPGQTFFIGLFNADMRAAFGLSHGGIGDLYLLGTVASAATFVWVGKLIDRVDLRWYTVAASAGLIGTCALTALAPGVVVLTIALFALRLTGQGLMYHTAATAMARYFDRDRGKALAISSMGLPIGEALLPVITVAAIAAIGWRATWWATAIVLAATLIPAALWLLRGQAERDRKLAATGGEGGGTAAPDGRHWTRAEVLRDPRFYVAQSALMAFPFLGTGFFFHQEHIATSKGWPLELIAAGLTSFAVVRVGVSLLCGPILDRFGARRMLVWSLVPMAATLIILASFDHPAAGVGYMAMLGVAVGVLLPVLGALFPELYGVRNIGAVRSVSVAFAVFGTALSPSLFGRLFDVGVSIEQIALGGLAYIALAAVGIQLVIARPERVTLRAD